MVEGQLAAPPAAVARIKLLDVSFDAVTLDQAVERVLELCRTPSVDLILTPNVDHLIRTTRDAEFKRICQQGSLVVADGAPVVWTSRLLSRPLPERVCGSDLMPRIAEQAARAGLRYFLVGGPPGDAEKAAKVIADRAGLDGSCGVDCPPHGFERDKAYLSGLVERINEAQPDIVFIGLGSPKQEKLMIALRDRVEAGVMMAVGATFSFVAGTVRRAPTLIQALGLEWAWRLVCEPRRLWRRYAHNIALFPWLVLRELVRTTTRPQMPGR